MHLSIDPAVRAACPDLVVGLVCAKARIAAHDGALWAEVAARLDDVRRVLTLADIPSLPEIRALRRAYRAVGKDPTRYRGSQEALLRRVLKGASLHRVNTIVDINNLVSIESRHSLGTFDADRLDGAVTLRVGRPGEVYKGIGKDVLNLANLPVYVDAAGPFGSPTSDSERARITPATVRILMTVTAFSGGAGLQATLDRAVALLERHAGAHAIETTVAA